MQSFRKTTRYSYGLVMLGWAMSASANQSTSNLISDPEFDKGRSGFNVNNPNRDFAERSSEGPLTGGYSLNFGLSKNGSNLKWRRTVSGTTMNKAQKFTVSGLMRSNQVSDSVLYYCAQVFFEPSGSVQNCVPVEGKLEVVSSQSVTLNLDPTLLLNRVQIKIYQSGNAPVDYTLDQVSAVLVLPTSTPSPSPTPMPTPTPTPVPTATPTPTGKIWIPALNTPMQWQLSASFNPTTDLIAEVVVYDIDLFDNSAQTVAAIHNAGAKAICYLSAGTYENWRPDAALFPSEALGNNLDDWPGERWLDIRNAGVRKVMLARMDLCKQKGFDALEPDNIDGYSNGSGFPLTSQDQIDYNKFLAQEAHARGLSVGLKNDLDQVGALVSSFDWALNEQCFQYKECDTLLPFIKAGKAVFNVEYSLATTQFCPQANSMNFNSMKKNLSLDRTRQACR